jgi:hypothetical protein
VTINPHAFEKVSDRMGSNRGLSRGISSNLADAGKEAETNTLPMQNDTGRCLEIAEKSIQNLYWLFEFDFQEHFSTGLIR